MNKNMKITAVVLAVLFIGIISAALIISAPDEDADNDGVNQNQESTLDTSQDNQQETEQNMLAGTQLEGYEPRDEVNELEIIDTQEGDGEAAGENATVTAHYTGAYADTGEIFESSKDTGEPFTSPLSGLIEGWQEGIPGMKTGGTRRLIIPAAQAYGDRPMVFDIELIAVE